MNRYRISSSTIRVALAITAVFGAFLLLEAALATYSIVAALPGSAPQFQETPAAEDVSQSAPTPIAPIGLLSPTIAISETSVPTGTATAEDTATTEVTDANVANGAEPEKVLDASIALSGTIVSNRTNYGARFFLEGQMYRIPPFASAGIVLARDTAVLNLYTCDAETPETQDGCYWDPYLLQRDGFFEIVDESTVVGLPTLTLGDAGVPPGDQVWIHNRTGVTESVVFRDMVYEVAPGAVHEFDVEAGAPAIVYVRSCGSVDDASVCEWAPSDLEPGAYFAMVEVSTPGGIPGSRLTAVDFRPVLGSDGSALTAPTQVVCDLRVPALNIRSGPGLQYQIVGKIRGAEEEAGRVAVTGVSADGLWYTVAESASASGWVTGNPDFLACRSSTTDLPIAEFSGATLVPTPEPTPAPVVQQPPSEPLAPEAISSALVSAAEQQEAQPEVGPQQEAVPDVETAEAVTSTDLVTPTEETGQSDIPEGLAMLVVNNGFQYPIRFTVDQRYRPFEGSSEYDLEPSSSTNVIVFPGTVAFTASSPWNGLSGNADIEVGQNESAVLWLRFEAEPDDSSQWTLAWQ